MFATLNNQDKSAFIVFDSSLKMFTGVYRVIKGFFCNICGENPMITIEFPRNL